MSIDRAHLSDCNELVELHLTTFKGFFLTSLGPRFLKLLYHGFLSHKSGLALVAKRDCRVVGFAIGTSQPSQFFRTLLLSRWWLFSLAALEGLLRAPFAVFKKCLSAFFYRGDEPDELKGRAALLSSLAVDPEHAGNGIGRALVEAFASQAAQACCDSIYLLTDRYSNDTINRFYENCGFVLLDTIDKDDGRAMNRWSMCLAKHLLNANIVP